jgi:hypothetical protein
MIPDRKPRLYWGVVLTLTLVAIVATAIGSWFWLAPTFPRLSNAAANETAILSYQQTKITLLGVILGLLTLVAAVAAAVGAWIAAWVAKTALLVDLSPFLSVEIVDDEMYAWTTEGFTKANSLVDEIWFVIKNSGKSPAIIDEMY